MDLKDKSARQVRETQDLNKFGMCVHGLMLTRGYKTLNRLAADMTEDREDGYKITRQALSNYTTGKRAVPTAFTDRFIELLDLDETEQRELAWALLKGQH